MTETSRSYIAPPKPAVESFCAFRMLSTTVRVLEVNDPSCIRSTVQPE